MYNNLLESHHLSWNNCIDICTDGTKAMVGKLLVPYNKSGQCQQNETAVIVFITTTHQQKRKKPGSVKKVLGETVTVINFIKYGPLKYTYF